MIREGFGLRPMLSTMNEWGSEMATVRENLIAAKALIDTPEKWLKGALSTGDDTCFCAMGALGHAGGFGLVASDKTPEMASLLDSIPASFVWVRDRHRLAAYNDHPNTTHADIMALFDRAIAACEE